MILFLQPDDASNMKPRALDLFCGAGGSARGLQNAGFWVLGIDHREQPRYAGDAFVQADALNPPVRLDDFDLVWSSPPCQHASIGAKRWQVAGRVYPDLIEATRALMCTARAWVIENVPGAKIRRDLVLTGAMFGLNTYRRRHFEMSFLALAQNAGRPFGPLTRAGSFTAAGNGGHRPNRPRLWAEQMGVDWMIEKHEIAQAIPPVYSEFIGRSFLRGHSGSGANGIMAQNLHFSA